MKNITRVDMHIFLLLSNCIYGLVVNVSGLLELFQLAYPSLRSFCKLNAQASSPICETPPHPFLSSVRLVFCLYMLKMENKTRVVLLYVNIPHGCVRAEWWASEQTLQKPKTSPHWNCTHTAPGRKTGTQCDGVAGVTVQRCVLSAVLSSVWISRIALNTVKGSGCKPCP